MKITAIYNKLKQLIHVQQLKHNSRGKVTIGKYVDILGLTIRASAGTNIKIGNGFSVRNNVILNLSAKAQCQIGSNVFINDNSAINSRKSIIIGDNTNIGQNVLIYDHDHDYKNLDLMRNHFILGKVEIGNNVWLGSNVVILRDTFIGDNCVIGAGTVVKGTIPADTLYKNKRVVETKSLL